MVRVTAELLQRIKAAKKAVAVARSVDPKAGRMVEEYLTKLLGFSHPAAGIPDIKALLANGLEPGAGEVTLTSEQPYGKLTERKIREIPIHSWAGRQRRTISNRTR